MAKEIQRQTDQGTGVIGARVARLQLAISGLLGKSPSLRSNLATLAVAWAAFATLELALYVLMPRTALHSHDLPVGARILLFCYSLTVLTFFLLLAGAAIMATVSSCWRFFPDRRGVRVVVRLLIALPIWLILICYGASWGLFWQTGSFIASPEYDSLFGASPAAECSGSLGRSRSRSCDHRFFQIQGTYTITAWIPRLVRELTLRKEPRQTDFI